MSTHKPPCLPEDGPHLALVAHEGGVAVCAGCQSLVPAEKLRWKDRASKPMISSESPAVRRAEATRIGMSCPACMRAIGLEAPC